jgi:hypothetical protein
MAIGPGPRLDSSVRRISFSVARRCIGRSRSEAQTPVRNAAISAAEPCVWNHVNSAVVVPL